MNTVDRKEIIRILKWMHFQLESHAYPNDVNQEDFAIELMNIDDIIKALEEKNATIQG